MNIVKIVEKHQWYLALIAAGCPNHLLKVAFVILDYVDGREGTDRYGWAYPTVEQIKEATGLSQQRISEHSKELTDNGWLVKEIVQRQAGRKTFYMLAYGSQFEVKGKAVPSKQTAPLQRGRNTVHTEPQHRSHGTGNTVPVEVATPLATDDKHLLQTSIETERETETSIGFNDDQGNNTDRSEIGGQGSSILETNKDDAVLDTNRVLPPNTVRNGDAGHVCRDKETCPRPACKKARGEEARALVSW